MSNIESIKRAIEAYLNREETPYSIMIDGDWGVGKTHLFKKEIVPIVGDDEHIYISLFGLETIQDIDNEIFKFMSSIADSDEGFIKGILNSSPQNIDDIKVGGLGYAVQFAFKKWKSSRLKKSKSLILCFDDFERWKGDVRVCLSYINKLVEHEKGKCIVIGSLDKLGSESKKSILNAKEKTIRHIYKLEVNPRDVIYSSLQLVSFANYKSEQYIKQLITENEHRIVDILKGSNYQNIRIVSDSVQFLDYIYCNNEEVFNVSKASAISYYCCLLSTLILFRKYLLDEDIQRRIVSHGDDQSFEILHEIGYFKEEGDSNYIGRESKYLLEQVFYKDPEIKLVGIFSIVEKGFYCEKDFKNCFNSWKETQAFEYYLDVFTYWYMEDAEADNLFREACRQIFDDRSVKNPVTLLAFADRVINDIKRGILNLEFDKTKERIISLFDELYEDRVMDRVPKLKNFIDSSKFVYSKEVLEYVCKRHEQYMADEDIADDTKFWCLLKMNPQRWHELFKEFKYKPVFTFYDSPQEVIDGLENLKNSDIFELTRILGSRLSDPNCSAALNLEEQNSDDLSEAILSKYSNNFGIRSGHFKQLARILKNRSDRYDLK
ncbi:hypothetical protein Misp06_04302 [Microbulbifer sp. NBRC 101763]|uniref:P-loop NTPase fold protein n=1 Tax=Microbulbifer sp. NBRC 101763 TaxID=1113820 RepID=UPI0030B7B99C